LADRVDRDTGQVRRRSDERAAQFEKLFQVVTLGL
jgi:hypothetical protein